jgi:hypothetical protein
VFALARPMKIPMETLLRLETESLAASRPGGDMANRSVVLAAAVAATVPLAMGMVAWSAVGGDADFNRRVTLAPFDLALFALLALEVRAYLLRASGRTHDGGGFAHPRRAHQAGVHIFTVLVVGLGLTFAAAFVAHPSPRGVELALRIAAGAALARVVIGDRRARAAMAATLLAVGGLQALLAVAQAVHGAAFGLRWVEFDGPLYSFADSHAGRGGLDHPYHLAVYLTVAVGAGWTMLPTASSRARAFWLAGIVACGTGLGVTYSRTLIVGVVGAGVVLGWHLLRRRPADGLALVVLPFVALGLGIALTAVPLSSGWVARYDTTTTAGSVSSGRVDFARQALDISSHDPLLGVGPGRYTIELAELGHTKPLPVHNLVLLVTAEAGVPAGLLMATLAALLAGRWLRLRRSSAGALVGAAFCLVAPFYLLDAYPMTFPTGLALTALWIAVLESARRSATQLPATQPSATQPSANQPPANQPPAIQLPAARP